MIQYWYSPKTCPCKVELNKADNTPNQGNFKKYVTRCPIHINLDGEPLLFAIIQYNLANKIKVGVSFT